MKFLLILLLVTGVYAQHSKFCVDVNLKSDSGKRTLDACMYIDTSMKDYIVRHNLIVIFSSKTVEEIASKKGKQKVLEQVKDKIKSIHPIYLSKFKIN